MNKDELLFIVTGTTRGLGNSIYLELLEEQNNILTINKSYFKHNENIIFDFTEVDELERKLIPKLKEKIKNYKTIVMILNAGMINPIKEIGSYDTSDIINIFNANCISPIALTNFIVQENKKGVVLNVTTGGINYNFEGLGLYTASKNATHKCFDIANIEDTNMSFVNFDPGTMKTQMTDQLRDDKNHFQVKSREHLNNKMEENTFKSTNQSAQELLEIIYDLL